MAKSWLLSRCYYRLHGLRLAGPVAERVWYFAYGANMHDSAFRERRGCGPSNGAPDACAAIACASISKGGPKAEPRL